MEKVFADISDFQVHICNSGIYVQIRIIPKFCEVSILHAYMYVHTYIKGTKYAKVSPLNLKNSKARKSGILMLSSKKGKCILD